MAQNFKDNGQLLPKELTNAILLKAYENSVVGQLSGNQAIKFGETSIPVFQSGAALGQVAEQGTYGKSTVSTSFKTLTPIKMGTIIVVSKELAQYDPANILDHIEADLTAAVAKAFDDLILSGKDGKGVAVTNQSNVFESAKRVEVAGGDYKAAILAALDSASEDYDPNGIAFDTSLRSRLAGVVGEVQYGLPNLATPNLQIAGYNAVANRAVGRAGGKLIVGDWTKVKAGFTESVTIEKSDQVVVDGVSMFETDQIALKVSTRIGGVVLDTDAFAIVEEPAEG